MGGIKFSETLKLRMIKGLVEESSPVSIYFNSFARVATNDIDIEEATKKNVEIIMGRIGNFQERGSNWRVLGIEVQFVNIVVYSPSGSSYIKLPECLNNSKTGLINLQNEHEKCFMWCHVKADFQSSHEAPRSSLRVMHEHFHPITMLNSSF